MKTGMVIKSADKEVSKRDLELINKYTRKEMTAQDVYVFSVVLCDNDIDRDFESFTVESLYELEKLFVGKTGVFDHNASAHNQTSRVFECKVEKLSGRKTQCGEDYFRLVGRAYMPKSDKNRDLIMSIDSGIVKEVSVGCAVRHTLCSVCNNDIYSPQCHHTKGVTYNKTLCYAKLSDVYDAYEFSFVAVPAQKEAGVIKAYAPNEKETVSMKELLSELKKSKEVLLDSTKIKGLLSYICKLEQKAEDGEFYKEQLKGDVCKCMSVSQPKLSVDTIKSIVSKMSVCELREVLDAHNKQSAHDDDMYVQLSSSKSADNKNAVRNQFTI